MADWLGRWTCNLVVPGSSPRPCYSPDLFLVAPSSTPWLHFINSQLACHLFDSCLFVCIGAEKLHAWGGGGGGRSGQLRW